MPIVNNRFEAFKAQLEQQIVLYGMTFNPSIDCRKDLVNFYGYTLDQVCKMSDDEVFHLMDKFEAIDKGETWWEDEPEETLPEVYKDKKCSCGGSLKVLFVDCETRGDCEIYVCECVECSKMIKLNYAAEWFEDYEEEQPEPIQEPLKVAEDTRSLDDIDLSCRTYNCLKRAGYDTVQQVKNATMADLCKVRNLGRRSLEELEEVLNIKFVW